MSSALSPSAAPSSDRPLTRPLTRPLGGPTQVNWVPWAKAAAITVLFFWLYRFNLQRLWSKTNFFYGDPDWSHSMCVPLIGAYYLFLRRDEIAAIPVEPLLPRLRFSRARFVGGAILIVAGLMIAFVVASQVRLATIPGLSTTTIALVGYAIAIMGLLVVLLDWGLSLLLGGLAVTVYGIYPGRNDFVWDSGMIITLFGAVLTLCGWRVMRIAWFPIAFLFCSLPWPPLVYSQIASPLQVLAARTATSVLQIFNIDANVGGTKIFIPQYKPDGTRLIDRALNVEEACAGLRSLMTFISVAAAVAFLSSRSLWQKIIITLSAIPIAISCNVMRVSGQGLIDVHLGREWSEGFAHQFAGMVMLLPAFFLIMLVCWIVDHAVIEDTDVPAAGQTAGGAA